MAFFMTLMIVLEMAHVVFMDIGPSPINVIRVVINKTLIYRLV